MAEGIGSYAVVKTEEEFHMVCVDHGRDDSVFGSGSIAGVKQ
jgi:hypothetical protein